MNRLICSALLLASIRLFADPTFATSTFDAGNEGWQPNNWLTTTVNGQSPGNPYLKIAADGSGKLGKMITFNSEAEWTGDYYSAGVSGIRMDISNMSDFDDLYLRVALGNRASPQQPGGTWFLSVAPIHIPASTPWISVFLPLAESDLIRVGNIDGESDNESYQVVFSDIQAIRILSAATPLGATGDEFFGDVGIDNVALVPEPSTLPLVGLGSLIVFYGRRRNSKHRLLSGTELVRPKPMWKSTHDFLSENRFF